MKPSSKLEQSGYDIARAMRAHGLPRQTAEEAFDLANEVMQATMWALKANPISWRARFLQGLMAGLTAEEDDA
jgi:hypothetical protein